MPISSQTEGKEQASRHSGVEVRLVVPSLHQRAFNDHSSELWVKQERGWELNHSSRAYFQAQKSIPRVFLRAGKRQPRISQQGPLCVDTSTCGEV